MSSTTTYNDIESFINCEKPTSTQTGNGSPPSQSNWMSSDGQNRNRKSVSSTSTSCGNQNYADRNCMNCRNLIVNNKSQLNAGQSNTKLMVLKTVQGGFKEVSIITVAEALTFIFGERFYSKKFLADRSEGSVTKTLNNDGEIKLSLCSRCGDLVQNIYNFHKEFQEMCHMDSSFQRLFKGICTSADTDINTERVETENDIVVVSVEGGGGSEDSINNSEDADEVEMIVPAVVYGDDEKNLDEEESEREVLFLTNVNAGSDQDDYEYEEQNHNVRRTRKRKRKPFTEPSKRKQTKIIIELPKLPPRKMKPKASLKSILEKLKQRRLISKETVELRVEKLEWKRRRLENSLHLFKIKKGRRAVTVPGEEPIERFSKFQRPKMRANDIIPMIPCPDCGKTCNKRFLEAHQNVMHKRISHFMCNICGRLNRDFENLKLHLSTHPRKLRPFLVKERRTAICHLCGRILRRSILNLHIAIHGIPRQFNCKKCDSRFDNSRDLKDHQVVHEEGGYYAFKCDSCTQGFKIESFLIQHHLICEMRAVDRPFRCSFCEKRFKLKHHLESHLFEVHRLSKEESRGMVYPGLAKRTVNRKKK